MGQVGWAGVGVDHWGPLDSVCDDFLEGLAFSITIDIHLDTNVGNTRAGVLAWANTPGWGDVDIGFDIDVDLPPSGFSVFLLAIACRLSPLIGVSGSPALWFGVRSDMRTSLNCCGRRSCLPRGMTATVALLVCLC